MEKKIIFWVLSLSLVAIALAILLPGGRQVDSDPKLPWETHLTPQGALEVFDLTLGTSSLNDARQVFQMQGELNLFIDHNGNPALEAYFERVFLSGLRADFILVLDADSELLSRLYDRGSRISRTSQSTHKVELSSEDHALATDLPIKLINYIPYANLDEELVTSRFGQPAEKITETETGVTHWIYTENGISIGLNPDGKELIQYMPLSEIEPLTNRIEENNRQYEETLKQQG
ncbi:MAG: hypothetical protein KZQ73_07515 [Candidatus Thiodiazotropha sp. (ex Semelilucina semeliformis)]|nr:hypothetical protein [Candidatus Thiodiazotropha sp. (ex Semelilucina semeliformis)]MCU7830000.1 hypothetical protein [Candidatus Thiodiazotropha sp. (ex Myrtea sp. 'scaly one' KF741663)]